MSNSPMIPQSQYLASVAQHTATPGINSRRLSSTAVHQSEGPECAMCGFPGASALHSDGSYYHERCLGNALNNGTPSRVIDNVEAKELAPRSGTTTPQLLDWADDTALSTDANQLIPPRRAATRPVNPFSNKPKTQVVVQEKEKEESDSDDDEKKDDEDDDDDEKPTLPIKKEKRKENGHADEKRQSRKNEVALPSRTQKKLEKEEREGDAPSSQEIHDALLHEMLEERKNRTKKMLSGKYKSCFEELKKKKPHEIEEVCAAYFDNKSKKKDRFMLAMLIAMLFTNGEPTQRDVATKITSLFL